MTRSITILILCFCGWCAVAQPMPQSVRSMPIRFKPLNLTLQWSPSASKDIIEYIVWHGAFSGTYTQSVSAGMATSITFSNVVKTQTHYFAATAKSVDGRDSDYSNEVRWPFSQVITVSGIALESVEHIGDGWNPLWTDTYSVTNPIGSQFFHGLTATTIAVKSLP
jgi:hypothetical protein